MDLRGDPIYTIHWNEVFFLKKKLNSVCRHLLAMLNTRVCVCVCERKILLIRFLKTEFNIDYKI